MITETMNTNDLIKYAGVRAPSYVLASILSSYPDELFVDNVTMMLEDSDVLKTMAECGEPWPVLKEHLQGILSHPDALEDLRSDFIEIFERARGSNSLYETEYGRARSMVKGNELVDIAGFYQAFGFQAGGDDRAKDMVDHVAVELEFYALLLFKLQALASDGDGEGVEIVSDAARKFLNDHLGRFVPSIRTRPGVEAHPYYRVVFECLTQLVSNEAQIAGVNPDIASWIGGQEIEGDMSCGSLGCLSGNPDVMMP